MAIERKGAESKALSKINTCIEAVKNQIIGTKSKKVPKI
jgi:hypothetical protein